MAERKTPNKGYQKLKSDLSAGNIGQVYIFYGEESYLREYYLGEIKKKLVPAGFEEFNYHRLSGKTLTMQELNGNEKFADLPHPLPPNPIRPETLYQGDLMLYGGHTVVLFYETFRTSYSYTPIGKVVAANTLQDAVGRGNIKVSFSMMK